MIAAFVGAGETYALLAAAARRVWGWEKLPPIERLPGGKPWFPDAPEHQFSLSHSGELALCALADGPVGADIEVIRLRSAGLPEYVFREEEQARWRALGGDWPAFYILWTERESIVKYTGEGLKSWRRAVLPEGCVLSNLSGPNWRGAVCAREKCGPAFLLEKAELLAHKRL